MASASKSTAAKRKKATRSTPSGRLAIAILGGLAIGLAAMAIYGMRDSGSDWAFNRPEAQLPLLQTKHTLQ
jgi:H+/Cl- antiporter ClcA